MLISVYNSNDTHMPGHVSQSDVSSTGDQEDVGSINGPAHLSTEEIYPTPSPINDLIMTAACVWHKDKCYTCTVVPTKSDSDVMFCLQSYQGLIIDRSLVY